uniref:Uncharacterized protein n=1 Tax=Callithrix jacchus TaxID=9483 RepID=A0A8I3WVD0_CALJA
MPHTGELWLTPGRYPSGTKLPEESSGSSPHCSAAPMGDSQAHKIWSGPPAVLQQRDLTVRRKTKKQKKERTSTQRPQPKSPTSNIKGRQPMTIRRNQHRKNEIIKDQNISPPRDHNSSLAREQNRMENEFDELTEAGFRRWVITNFSELKEHVLTQCKETKNLEKIGRASRGRQRKERKRIPKNQVSRW